MNRKSLLIIICIIILIAIAGIFAYTQFYSNTQAKFKYSTFDLPTGYHTIDSNEANVVNTTNGHEIVCIKEYNDSDVNKHITDYVKSIEDRNKTVHIKNFTVDNVVIYKSNIDGNNHNYHFWFKNNGKVYTCYTDNGYNNNIENDVVRLVKSTA